MFPKVRLNLAAASIVLVTSLGLVACADKPKEEYPSFGISLNIPDSMTGGKSTSAKPTTYAGDLGCDYLGASEAEPFKNGYNMTKFTVGVMASWTCIADRILGAADQLAADGVIHAATENDAADPLYDPTSPTHYSVTQDSATQKTFRLYYNFEHAFPPTANMDVPGFYVSWDANDATNITQGKLIIDAADVSGVNVSTTDQPIAMRMDFEFTTAQKSVDMAIQFGAGNVWADGMRLNMVEDLNAAASDASITALGRMQMKQQFATVAGVSEIPTFELMTVSDAAGNGAAVALFTDVGLAFPDIGGGVLLGDYIFTKDDKYYFNSTGTYEYINKTITSSEFRGSRSAIASDLDSVEAYLGMATDYFDTTCNVSVIDCTLFLDAVHNNADGFAGQEPNQGTDPLDWRSTAIGTPSYLTTVYLDGLSAWTGVFDHSFTPVQ